MSIYAYVLSFTVIFYSYAKTSYVDLVASAKLTKSGDTISGPLAMGSNKITGVGDPTSNQDAATKN